MNWKGTRKSMMKLHARKERSERIASSSWQSVPPDRETSARWFFVTKWLMPASFVSIKGTTKKDAGWRNSRFRVAWCATVS